VRNRGLTKIQQQAAVVAVALEVAVDEVALPVVAEVAVAVVAAVLAA
jgi:hypothetical protein